MTTFQGIWPALITPFDAENTVNTAELRKLTTHLLARKVDGFYLCGSTGEGILMSVNERKHVVETVLTEVNGRVPVIVHVGTIALVDVIDLARHARDCGASGVSSIIPPKYTTMQSLSGYFGSIASSVPDMPVIPNLLNPEINVLTLVEALLPYPNFAGTKYTGANMYELHQIVKKGGGRDWTVFSGMDEQSLYAAMMGSSCHIGSTLNLIPGAYRRIRDLCLAGQHVDAQYLQERTNAIVDILYQTGSFFAALKVALRWFGLDCGEARLPERALTEDQAKALIDTLKSADFAELVAL